MVSTRHLFQSLALPLIAAAQIVPSCNPILHTGCPADKALATSFSEDFKEPSKWFSPAVENDDRIKYSNEGVSLTLAKRYDNPALKSNFYIMFGKVEVTLKAAPGRGVVSSFYLQSDDLDEIDLEWVGSDITEVQTNYFSKGNIQTYDRGQFHGVDAPQEKYHTYTIDWTKDQLNFYLDGALIRTLKADAPQGYPQSPMYIVMGIWAGGDPSNQPGTIEWAGGLVDYSQAPFSMHVKNVIVSDYSTGKEYRYGDQSGKWTSIEAVDGEVNGREETAEKEFNVLANGGNVDNSSFDFSTPSQSPSESSSQTSQESSSSPSSSQKSQESSSSSSSSSTEEKSSSQESSSSSQAQLESSKSRASTVYSSSASSLISRSDSSSRSSRAASSAPSSSEPVSLSSTEKQNASSTEEKKTLQPESSAPETTTLKTSTGKTSAPTSNSLTKDQSTNEISSSPASSSSDSKTTYEVATANDGLSLTVPIGQTGIKALLFSIAMTLGLLMI